MTREEAIKHFKEQLDIFGGEHAEAIKVAIEALQTPPISQRSMYQAGYRQGREEALKREPSGDGTLEVKVEDATKVGRVLISDDKHRGGLYYPDEYEPKGEDLISRADAIEAMGEEPPVWCDEDYEIAERDQWREDIEAIKSVPSADRPRGEWISKEELIDAINDLEVVYDGDEGRHKEHDISKLVRAIFKDIIDNLPSANMRGDTE